MNIDLINNIGACRKMGTFDRIRDAMDFRDPERQCEATSKQTGERCKNRPVAFQKVCVVHGAKSHTAILAAQRLKIIAAEPAWATLIELLDHPEAAWRYRAAVAILDRSGYNVGVNLNVSASVSQEDLSMLSTEELAIRAQEISRKLLTARDFAVDASVVEVTDAESDVVNIDDFDGAEVVQSCVPTNREDGEHSK